MTDRRPDPPRADSVDSAELISFGGPVDGVTVCLRFFGDELDPDEVSRALGCQPTRAIRKGESAPGRYHRVATTGSWLLEGAPADPPDVEEMIRGLLAAVSSDQWVWTDLTRRFSADIFCGLFLKRENRGFELSAALSAELAARNLVVGFDIYGPGRAE